MVENVFMILPIMDVGRQFPPPLLHFSINQISVVITPAIYSSLCLTNNSMSQKWEPSLGLWLGPGLGLG